MKKKEVLPTCPRMHSDQFEVLYDLLTAEGPIKLELSTADSNRKAISKLREKGWPIQTRVDGPSVRARYYIRKRDREALVKLFAGAEDRKIQRMVIALGLDADTGKA